jgi:glycosyltransferase involved in cell wall biosynthesis
VVRVFPATPQPAAFLHASDFTVLASLWEGTPNSVLESLAVGKPALVSVAANESGLIKPGVTGWEVATGDVSSLALGLERALRLSDDHLAAMAPACRVRAADFAMPTMIACYESLYDELVQNSGRGKIAFEV